MTRRRNPSPDDASRTSSLPAAAMLEGLSLWDLIDSLPLSLVLKDLQGRRVFANQHYLRFHGKTSEEVLNKTDFELFPDLVAKKFAEDDRRVLASGRVLRDVERVPLPGGGSRWIERLKSPARDHHGKTVGIQLLFWDVTKRVEAETALEEERYLLHTLLANIPDSIYFKDRESRLVRLSNSMAKKFGLRSPQQAVGKTDADIFTEEHAAQARADEVRIMETGIPLIGRVEKETWPDRPDTWCSTTKLPLRNSAGAVVGTFGISRDITEQMQIQAQLQQARDAADQANRAKGEFLANMSHEIRTPMNGILGMAELLSHTPLDAQQRDFVDLIRQSGDSLMRLLNDILDFSKIEAGRMELESVDFSLRENIAKTAQMLAVRAADKPIELACRIDPQLPDAVIGDPNRLRQVVVNLVGNAIKFTEQGEVVVEVLPEQPPGEATPPAPPEDTAARGDQPLIQWVRIAVRDTGIGIPEDKLSTIFEAFAQADSSTTRRFGGTGLGLSISTQLVKLMGGDMVVQSQPGKGSTFSFRLPLQVAPSAAGMRGADRAELQGLPVLIVDDNTTNRRILVELLDHWKLRPTAVAGAVEAIEQLHAAAGRGDPFQLGLFDMMMPEVDGLMLTAQVRADPRIRDLPIIILSSAARPGDLDRCRRDGIARYLLKPLVHSELLDAILDTVAVDSLPQRRRDAAPAADQDAQGRQPRRLRVLLAEDGLVNRRVAVELLKMRGHQVTVAEDGRQAVQRCRESRFDVILMDLQMPGMDGLEATAAIRQMQVDQDRPTPIIAMTARAMRDDRQRCLEAGMDGFLAKPVDPKELDRVLAEIPSSLDGPSATVDSADGAPADRRARELAAGGAERSESTVPSDATLDLLLSRFEGRFEAVRQLADSFCSECPQLISNMQRALAEDDPRRLRRYAHTLRGSAQLFDAEQLEEICECLERGKADEIPQHAGRLVERLGQAADAALAAIRCQLRQRGPAQ